VIGAVAAAWGMFGVAALLGRAVWRLWPVALEAVSEHGLSGAQAAVCALWVVVSAYAEGYRAFQLRFCPRVVARALYLARHATPIRALLAPLFCIGLFGARRRTTIVVWSVTLAIVGLVLLVGMLPQPWRGIVDAGVVVGLGWGIVALAVEFVTVATGRRSAASAELPCSPP